MTPRDSRSGLRRLGAGGVGAMRQAMFGFLVAAIFLAYASMAIIIVMH
ncbi:MAG: hypothetical protein AB7K86_05245 [Rhodospirillales bacterium]